MLLKKARFLYSLVFLLTLCLVCCTSNHTPVQSHLKETEPALNYLKSLKGKWLVYGHKEGTFAWEFDVTSRGKVVVERLKAGTATEMTTIYHLDNGLLFGKHFCQLQNQPVLTAVTSELEGDLHFLCNGHVGNAKSHNDLHMHGVHFQKTDSSLFIWMDMYKNGKLAFETRYELFRVDTLMSN